MTTFNIVLNSDQVEDIRSGSTPPFFGIYLKGEPKPQNIRSLSEHVTVLECTDLEITSELWNYVVNNTPLDYLYFYTQTFNTIFVARLGTSYDSDTALHLVDLDVCMFNEILSDTRMNKYLNQDKKTRKETLKLVCSEIFPKELTESKHYNRVFTAVFQALETIITLPDCHGLRVLDYHHGYLIKQGEFNNKY